jgi:hypothetical protein
MNVFRIRYDQRVKVKQRMILGCDNRKSYWRVGAVPVRVGPDLRPGQVEHSSTCTVHITGVLADNRKCSPSLLTFI